MDPAFDGRASAMGPDPLEQGRVGMKKSGLARLNMDLAIKGVPLSQTSAPRLIFSPRWTQPAQVWPGETLQIVLAGSCPRDLRVWIGDTPIDAVTLRLGDTRENVMDGFRIVNARLPADFAAGLYDLHLVSSLETIAREPHSVWVSSGDTNRITFAHISDLHIGNPLPPDRERRIDGLFGYLARNVQPDFILNTGDLINRYVQNRDAKEILRPEIVCDHIHRAREMILQSRIPHFLTPGNHDVAFSYIAREWRRVMGGRWDRIHDDHAFSRGGIRFLGLDRSVMYDGDHKACDHHMTAAQHRWLRTELETLRPDQSGLIFCHYDYHRELMGYLKRYRILKVLYGHTAKSCLDPEYADCDGVLFPHVCQVFEWSAVGGLRLLAKMKLMDFNPVHDA